MKKYHQLTKEERYILKSLKKAGFSNKRVALIMGRPASTIGRELRRNCGCRIYSPAQAHEKALSRRKTPRRPAKMCEPVLSFVTEKLRDKWSPEQVSGWLPLNSCKSVSHECIYQYLAEDRRNGGVLYKLLRRRGVKYRRNRVKECRIKNRVSIEQRPECVDRKERVGDWEGDLIIGKGHKSAILTLVERKTKYALLAKLENNKNARSLMKKLVNVATPYKGIFHTLTVDNGVEFGEHEKIAFQMEAKVYFAHPYCSWERGLNENTNGLIRQFFPKGMDFSDIAVEQVLDVQHLLNGRPRKTLGFLTPYEALSEEIKKEVALVN